MKVCDHKDTELLSLFVPNQNTASLANFPIGPNQIASYVT